ncbi:MAG: Rieske 2Fe-2S domain-containing protein [Microcoleaceae cyanobacterium MO_207.B10]|nr:Rieske 2Fe-2S domain-containing protein [Microcoleaceae cyanobacterium MO_207.B10]
MMTNFSWTKQWYPVTPISYLDSSHPTPITLLGKRLVIWRDKQQKWIAMDDACPHKLAKLSLGSIDQNGDLMCRHHGWCFDGAGKCTNIPMLSDEKALETACKSERSQVQIYPTQVQQGLLWVWPDNSSNAVEDSTLKQPAVMPEYKFDASSTDWYMGEVPYSYTVSVETSLDPSHAQFLHEGTGFYPDKTLAMQHFEVFGEMSAEDGFTLKHSGFNVLNKDMDATRKFTPPCSNTTIYEFYNGKSALFQLYLVPTKPGYCKQIAKFIFDVAPQKRNFWFELLPKHLQIGLKHSSSYQQSDQDISMLHFRPISELTENKTW